MTPHWLTFFKVLSLVGAFLALISTIGAWLFSSQLDKAKVFSFVGAFLVLISAIGVWLFSSQLDKAREQTTKRLKSKVADMQPGLRLLQDKQVQSEDGKWKTKLVFGSSYPIAEFTVTLVFDHTYEEAKYYVTSTGMVATGKLDLIEGKTNSRVFRFRGTNLMANNYFVVEITSTEKVTLQVADLNPKPEGN